MTAAQRATLAEILRVVLELPQGSAVEQLGRETTKSWDSLAQVTLIAALESEFNIALDIGQYAALDSYAGIEATLGAMLG